MSCPLEFLYHFMLFFVDLIKYLDGSIKRWPLLPIVNDVALCGLYGLLLSWDLALG